MTAPREGIESDAIVLNEISIVRAVTSPVGRLTVNLMYCCVRCGGEDAVACDGECPARGGGGWEVTLAILPLEMEEEEVHLKARGVRCEGDFDKMTAIDKYRMMILKMTAIEKYSMVRPNCRQM